MLGIFISGTIFLAVVAMVIFISKFNQHPFLVLTVVAIVVGLVYEIPTEEVVNTAKSGFDNILTSIGIMIPTGTIIGTILEETDVVLTIANDVLKLADKRNSVLIMRLTGYVTGIPMFCNSGFVVLGPISCTLTSQSNVSPAVMAMALSGGPYVTRCLVSPTPRPIAMAGMLEADLGLTTLIGLLISTPATISAITYVKKVTSKIDIPVNPEYTVDELMRRRGKLPGTSHSFSPILLPIILIALKSVDDFLSAPSGSGVLRMVVSFIGNPVIALVLGVSLAMTLIPKEEKQDALKWTIEGITSSTGILAIIGANDSFGAILQKFPTADVLSGSLLGLGVGVLLPSVIVALLKTAMGVSTVAMITASAMIAPMMGTLGFISPIAKVLVTMAIGVGSMTASYANDSCFWVVLQFSDMDTKTTYKCQTGMTAIMDIVTIVTVFVLSLIFV